MNKFILSALLFGVSLTGWSQEFQAAAPPVVELTVPATKADFTFWVNKKTKKYYVIVIVNDEPILKNVSVAYVDIEDPVNPHPGPNPPGPNPPGPNPPDPPKPPVPTPTVGPKKVTLLYETESAPLWVNPFITSLNVGESWKYLKDNKHTFEALDVNQIDGNGNPDPKVVKLKELIGNDKVPFLIIRNDKDEVLFKGSVTNLKATDLVAQLRNLGG